MNVQWSTLMVIFGIMKKLIYLATWYYISGYTPETQKHQKK